MNPAEAVVDLDDGEALLAADHDGVLRAVSMAGAQVRATAAAVDEGALDAIRDGSPPRAVVWVAGRGTAATAGTMLAAALDGSAAEPLVLSAELPSWVGALDVLVVAGDDPGDPSLAAAAATGVHRGARVVVAAPYEGPLRDATAGHAAVLEPRMAVPDQFLLSRYLAAGLAVVAAVDPGSRTDLAELADELDAEALRNSAVREVFTNPAKALAGRMFGHEVALVGDGAATLALARHGSSTLLRVGHTVAAAAGLADAVAAARARLASGDADIFYDDRLDGTTDGRLRVLALTLAAERAVVAARIGGLADVDLVAAADVPTVAGTGGGPADAGALLRSAGPERAEQQLAVLAVRLEMAAAYLRLLRG